jgi:predicted extracellular nuclease
MKNILYTCMFGVVFLLINVTITSAQEINIKQKNRFRIMFYNVENLFDTEDNPDKKDDEFLPKGNRYWSKYKYWDKEKRIYKVITSVGGWTPPDIVGICEIENRKVINDLVNNTPLVKFNYQIIHQESPDRRGIDVGLLYRKEAFKPIENKFLAINFPDNPESKTRDILYVKGIINSHDTLHIFVNHWPSRWGGQLESEPRRMFVASVLRNSVDSLFKVNCKTNIVIVGDLNDEPHNKSIVDTLRASSKLENVKDDELYNLSGYIQENRNAASNKYQGVWGMIDQFIVSGYLLNTSNSIQTTSNDVHVFKKDFLMEKDEGYYGFKPNRTFVGFRYNICRYF